MNSTNTTKDTTEDTDDIMTLVFGDDCEENDCESGTDEDESGLDYDS